MFKSVVGEYWVMLGAKCGVSMRVNSLIAVRLILGFTHVVLCDLVLQLHGILWNVSQEESIHLCSLWILSWSSLLSMVCCIL